MPAYLGVKYSLGLCEDTHQVVCREFVRNVLREHLRRKCMVKGAVRGFSAAKCSVFLAVELSDTVKDY